MIREEEPPRPEHAADARWARLPTTARRRRMRAAAAAASWRGELDWIVMKALEKDRDRRYETANGLAADIQRYLQTSRCWPARRARRYRLRKFVRRHTLGWRSARRWRSRWRWARRDHHRAGAGACAPSAPATPRPRRPARSRTSWWPLRGGRPDVPRQHDHRPGDPRRGAARIEHELADQPLMRARLLETMGQVYYSSASTATAPA